MYIFKVLFFCADENQLEKSLKTEIVAVFPKPNANCVWPKCTREIIPELTQEWKEYEAQYG